MAAIDYGVLAFKNGEQILDDVLIGRLSFTFYKWYCDVFCDGRDPIASCWSLWTYGDCRSNALIHKRKSRWFEIMGQQFHIRELAPLVYIFRADYNGDHYTVIYGSGIDKNPRVWQRVKHDYHTKRDAAKIDRAIERAGGYKRKWV